MANYFASTTELLVDTSARALLLAALAAIVLRFGPTGNANFQHRAWTAVLLGMLLLPVLAQFTPALSLLPSGWRQPGPVVAQSSAVPERTIPTQPSPPDQPAPIAMTAAPSWASTPSDMAASPAVQPAEVAGGGHDRNLASDSVDASGIPIGSVAAKSRAHQAAAMPKPFALSLPGVIAALYLCGVAALLSRFAFGCWAVRRLVRRATDIPWPLDGRARLAVSDAVRMPVSVGLLRPVILLPSDWSRWSQSLLNSVIAHEQAHIDRRDHLVLLSSELNRCLYWFHPVAWFLRRRLSELAEQCCDDAVIAALQSRDDYARHLLEIASRLTVSPRRYVPLGISMARSSRVESRIVAILDERRPLAGRIGRGGALTLAAIVAPILFLAAGLRAADLPPENPPAAAAKPADTAAETPAQPEPKTVPDIEKPPVKGATVRGRVVLEAGNSPVAGAEVRLLINNAQGFREGERDVASDEQGAFVFHDVPAGRHRLVAVTANMASRRERLNADWLKIAAGVAPDPVVLKLSPAPSIKVHVSSEAAGKPLAGAVVRLPQIGHDVTVDANGDTLLIGLTPENWDVRAQAAGFAVKSTELKLQGTQQAELSFALAPGGKIHGTVKDKEGNPLARAWVGLRREGEFNGQVDGTHTDAQGRFHFDFVPLGEPLTININEDDYARGKRDVSVAASGDVEADFALERLPIGGSVQGLVTGHDGKPIAGASVSNGWRNSRDRRETFTNAAGRFTIDDVQTIGRGNYVVVRAKGFAPQAIEFAPGPADAPPEIAVKLEPGHRIRGRVVDGADKPIAGARVKYGRGGMFAPDSVGGDGTTDAEGRFEFDSLPADCPFDVSAKGYSSTEDMELALDGPQEAVIRLQPQGILRGRVVNAATGKPVTKFRVRIHHSPDRKPSDPKGGGIWGRLYNVGERFESADGQFLIDGFSVGSPLQVLVDTDELGTDGVRRVVPRPADQAEVVEIKLGPTDPAMIGQVAGTVIDDQGQPKAGAQLRLVVFDPERENPNQSFNYNWRLWERDRMGADGDVVQYLSAVSGADGGFHFDHVRLDKDIQLAWWGHGISEGRMRDVEKLPAAERTAIHINNATPGAIAGKINRQSYPDLAQINIIHQGEGTMDHIDFGKDPDKAVFEFRNLGPGNYLVTIEGRDQPGKFRGRVRTLQQQMITVAAGKTTSLDLGFDADPGPAPAPSAPAKPASAAVANPLPPIDQPVDEEAVLAGRVVDDQKKPLPDALVCLPLGFAQGPLKPAHPLHTQTNAAGQFTFRIERGWLAGAGNMISQPTVWAYAPDHSLAFLSVRGQFEQRPAGEVELVLGPATDTAFKIVNPQGEPVAGARVVPRSFKADVFLPPDEIGAVVDGTSDTDGLARMPAIDRNGWRMLVVKAAGFGEQDVRSVWDDAELASTTTIPLRPVGRLEVKVTGDTPEHLTGLNVSVSTADRQRPFTGQRVGLPPTEGQATGVTNEHGEFIAPELAVGEAFVNVAIDHQQPLRPQLPKEIKITAGQTTRVEVPLVQAQRVRGLVRTKADGRPIANASVMVIHHLGNNTPQHEQARTDAEGRFEAYVLPGEIVVHVQDPPGLMQDPTRRGPPRDEVPEQEGVVELQPIEMVATKTITGRLVDQFNHPLEGKNVSAQVDGNQHVDSAKTAPDGSFSLQVPADAEPTYEVNVSRIGRIDADVVQSDPLLLRVRMVYPPGKKP